MLHSPYYFFSPKKVGYHDGPAQASSTSRYKYTLNFSIERLPRVLRLQITQEVLEPKEKHQGHHHGRL